MANQPAPPHWRELTELLLERGADPADDQALHINQSASLPVLLRYGLRPDARTRAADSFITLMGRELCQAARQGRTDMMKLLLVHNARTDEMSDGKTPWQHAMEHGHLELDLGFDPDWMDENAALHSAAGEGNEEMVRLLIGRGASLTLRDPWYDGTPNRVGGIF